MSQEECHIVLLDHHFKSSLLTKFYNSKYEIITHTQYIRLFTKELNAFKSQLLYRSTRDGQTVADFHKHCDDQFNLVIIVKSTQGDLFGGFTTQNLKLEDNFATVPDEDLFTFRFEDEQLFTFKLEFKYRHYALSRYGMHGPAPFFAFGFCFWVHVVENELFCSGTQMTETFILPECRLPQGKQYFGGSMVLVEELEVHKIWRDDENILN